MTVASWLRGLPSLTGQAPPLDVRDIPADPVALFRELLADAVACGVAEGDWMLWRLVPERVEFWQGRRDRNHVRLVHRREAGGWTHEVLRAESGADEKENR